MVYIAASKIHARKHAVKTLSELNEKLRRMRRETADYALTPDNDAVKLQRMRSECAALWGAIECIKKGRPLVLASQAKYLL
jgi:hypothetical protein